MSGYQFLGFCLLAVLFQAATALRPALNDAAFDFTSRVFQQQYTLWHSTPFNTDGTIKLPFSLPSDAAPEVDTIQRPHDDDEAFDADCQFEYDFKAPFKEGAAANLRQQLRAFFGVSVVCDVARQPMRVETMQDTFLLILRPATVAVCQRSSSSSYAKGNAGSGLAAAVCSLYFGSVWRRSHEAVQHLRCGSWKFDLLANGCFRRVQRCCLARASEQHDGDVVSP